MWLATFGCCAAGLLITLALTRPRTLAVLAKGAADALAYPLGCMVLRFRVARGEQRQQLRWLVAGATATIGGFSRWNFVVSIEPGDVRVRSRSQGQGRGLPCVP